MKSKKIEKKLTLNKTTLANLNNQEMSEIKGQILPLLTGQLTCTECNTQNVTCDLTRCVYIKNTDDISCNDCLLDPTSYTWPQTACANHCIP